VEAAFHAGAETVLIPKENWQHIFNGLEGVKVIPVERIEEVFQHVFGDQMQPEREQLQTDTPAQKEPLTASPAISILHAGSSDADSAAIAEKGALRRDSALGQQPGLPAQG
jgi:Lon-like ATP-dependent protease